LGIECALIGPEPAIGISAGIVEKAVKGLNRDHKNILGVLNRTDTDKGIATRILCQKNQGAVKTK
jgi:hypothetical protein